MSTFTQYIEKQGLACQDDVTWLHALVRDLQLLADLDFADIVLWIPTPDDHFIAVSQARPSNAATLFYRDFVGKKIKLQWKEHVEKAFAERRILEAEIVDEGDDVATKISVVPVTPRESKESSSSVLGPIAAVTRHKSIGGSRSAGRQQVTFNECAEELFSMISSGDFPDYHSPSSPRSGAPRASDGLIRLDIDGNTLFASPNALSAFNRLGFSEELEGTSFAEVATNLLAQRSVIDEYFPLVVTGRASFQTDLQSQGVTVALRSIPLRHFGEQTGSIMLCRDVTEVRHREQELITKDATIREIHHRVKNNLQTVASLLRIQSRQSHSQEVRDALQQAMRRVSAIAVVHDTLSEGLEQVVDFDDVFDRILILVTEVAASHNTKVYPQKIGLFGELPSRCATPLALALTELVTNAVEHGLAGRTGKVHIVAKRSKQYLKVQVVDDGVGLPEGKVGAGLGTQIVRTLIQGELGGTIDWHTLTGMGTEVTIKIPLGCS